MVCRREEQRRRVLIADARRHNREQAEASLHQAAQELSGRAYDDLLPLTAQPEYRGIVQGNRTFTVIVAATKELDASLWITLQVDDGGLTMYEPLTRSFSVEPKGRFPG